MTANEKSFSKHLSDYAAWLLHNRLDDFAREMLRLSFEMELPLLKFFNHLSLQELFELSKPGQIEFLDFLSKRDVKGHLNISMQRWLSDQLPLIGKYDVEAKDLTVGSHIRSKSLKHFVSKHIQPAANYIEIKVSDNGIGFSSDVSERIFGLFQRLHSKPAYEGSGLGLAICRKIAEQHGGTINASSEEGVGSTFTILLPRYENSAKGKRTKQGLQKNKQIQE